MTLSPTAKVILGMLRIAPLSGYEIKTFIDESTAFFYAAGYGSIYPELKRLREAGLVESREDPSGGRNRQVHALTADGETRLDLWMATPADTFELRDEGLLQVFFSPARESAAEALEHKARGHAAIHERLKLVELQAAAMAEPGPLVTLRYGLELHDFSRRWCEREAARLREQEAERAAAGEEAG